MVCSPQEPVGEAVVYRGAGELGIAFLEYVLQVPANRTGITVMQLGQLKILQEVIALSVFVPFAVLYMKQRLTLDYLWASLCIAGAA